MCGGQSAVSARPFLAALEDGHTSGGIEVDIGCLRQACHRHVEADREDGFDDLLFAEMRAHGGKHRLGDTYVRPHDVDVALEPDVGSSEAMVERVVHLGFEVRVELVRDDGQHLWAQLTQEQAQQLELERGQIVFVRPSRETVFSAAAKRPGLPRSA